MEIPNNPKTLNEKILELNDKKYNSAGVLIINKYSNKDCVVLFKSSMYVPSGTNKGKYYCDIPGGGIDEKDFSLEQTASRELYEESKKVFSISISKLNTARETNSFVELPGRRLSGKRKPGLFGCYVIRLPHVSAKVYNINKELLKKIKHDSVFYETNELIRIPISNIREYFADKKISDIRKQAEIKDINDNLQYITVQASKCLFLACVKKQIEKKDDKIIEKINSDNPFKLLEYKEVSNDLIEGRNKGITIKYF